jgi:hypothetical protein
MIAPLGFGCCGLAAGVPAPASKVDKGPVLFAKWYVYEKVRPIRFGFIAISSCFFWTSDNIRLIVFSSLFIAMAVEISVTV